jgi:MFS family permease
MAAANSGPSSRSLLGGMLADRSGWKWVFWFMVMLGGSFLPVLFLFFPETGRGIVRQSIASSLRHQQGSSLLCPWLE